MNVIYPNHSKALKLFDIGCVDMQYPNLATYQIPDAMVYLHRCQIN